MKGYKTLLYVLMVLPVAATLAVLQFLPDQIPAHYGFNGQVDRWGSKYETLIVPAMTLVFGLIMILCARYASKQEKDGRNNEKICILTGVFSLAVFNVMTAYFLYTSYYMVENLADVKVDLSQLVFVLMGVLMVVVGNVMPKLRKNSLIGLRTPWSMANEAAWKKSQRFGGIAFVVTGILLILVCLFTKGIGCFVAFVVIMVPSVCIQTYYTYKAAQSQQSGNQK